MGIDITATDSTWYKPTDAFPNELLDNSSPGAVKLWNSSISYSLVIPAYNEEERIGLFLDQISSSLPVDWEIIVVSDGDDRTGQIARSFGQRFRIFEYNQRLGKGGAILQGFKKASGQIIGYVDADGSISSADILKVFQQVNDFTPVAIGSRWVNGSKIATKQPFMRLLLGRLYHYFTFAILGIREKDTQCGVKAFSREVTIKLQRRVTVRNYSFDTAALFNCKKLGINISEVPITWKNVRGSKVSPFRESFFMLLTLAGLRLAHSSMADKFQELLTDGNDIIGSI